MEGQTVMTRAMAIKTFFEMSAKEAMTEIKQLMTEDRESFEWVARECARELGVQLKQA